MKTKLAIIIIIMSLSAVVSAQTATPAPNVQLNTNAAVQAMFDQINQRMIDFAPMIAIGIGISWSLIFLINLGRNLKASFEERKNDRDMFGF